MADRAPQNHLRRRTRRGFTLLEVIVTITALATLAVVAVPTYQRVTGEAADRSTAETLIALTSEATRTSFANNGRVELVRADVAFAAASLGGETRYTLSEAGTPSPDDTTISAEVLGAAMNLALRSPSGRCVTLSAVGVATPETEVLDDGPCIADEPDEGTPGGVSGSLASPLVANLVAPSELAANGALSNGGWSAVVDGDRVYGIARRTGPGDPEITCALRRSGPGGNAGDECQGYPADFTAAGGGDFSTSYSPDAVVIDGELWTTAAREAGVNDEVGVYCWDLQAALPCEDAWHPLASNIQIANHGIAAGAAVAPITGVQRSGTRLYVGTALPAGTRKNWWESGPFVPATAAQIHCFDTATNATCGTTNVAGSINTLPGWSYSENQHRAPTMVSSITDGGRMYFIIDHGFMLSTASYWNGSAFVFPSQRGNRIVCYDTNTNALCAGWTVPAVAQSSIAGPITASTNATSLAFENPNLANSLCVVTNLFRDDGSFGRMTSCYDATGGLINSGSANFPAAYATWMQSNPPVSYASTEAFALGNPVMFDGTMVGSRRYSVFQVDQRRLDSSGVTLAVPGAYTSVSCFDHSTNAPCAGFGTSGLASYPGITGGRGLPGNLGAFSISSDENGCLWVLGDYGNVVNIDPDTGAAGCGRSASAAALSAADLESACMVGEPELSYTHAALVGLAGNPISSATLTVSDDNGPLAGWEDVPFTDNTVDLSTVPQGAYTFTVNTLAGGPWASTPQVEIHFSLHCNV